MTLVDHDHIGWKSWKLTARTISPTPPLFVAQRQGHPPNPRGTWGNLAETGGGVGKSGVLEQKSGNISETRTDGEKSYHGGSIGTHQRSFERYHPRPPKASSFPILRVRNPIEKPQSLLSQERVKLYGLQIWPIHSYRVHPNQTHFGKSECGHIQGLSKVLKYTPYYLRNGYSYTNF